MIIVLGLYFYFCKLLREIAVKAGFQIYLSMYSTLCGIQALSSLQMAYPRMG